MGTDIQNRVAALQKRVFAENYYTAIWLQQLVRHDMSTATIDQHEHNDKELALLCHHVWEKLPDSKAIRRGPFWELCNIAELILDSKIGA